MFKLHSNPQLWIPTRLKTLTWHDLTLYNSVYVGFQPTPQNKTKQNKKTAQSGEQTEKVRSHLPLITTVQAPNENIHAGTFSLLWITPLFTGRLTLQLSKSLIHGKKGTVLVGCFFISPPRAKCSLLAALSSLMFSLGFGSSAPTAKHRKQTRLKFWGLLKSPPFGQAIKPTKGRAAKVCLKPKHEALVGFHWREKNWGRQIYELLSNGWNKRLREVYPSY